MTTTTIANVNLKSVNSVVRALIAARRPVMFYGQPGVGKTAFWYFVAKQLNARLLVIHPVLEDPVDSNGIPYVAEIDGEKLTRWAVADKFPRTGRWIVLFDELPQATEQVQSSYLNLIHNGSIGTYKAPTGSLADPNCDDAVFFAATGNRVDDGCNSVELSAALRMRFAQFNITFDIGAWCEWALENGIDETLVGFARFAPQVIESFNPDLQAQPSARGLEFINDALQANEDLASDRETLSLVCQSIIGAEGAAQYLGYCDCRATLPDPDSIKTDPNNAKLPNAHDLSANWAIATALVYRCKSDSATWLEPSARYVARLPQEQATASYSDLYRLLGADAVEATDGYKAWIADGNNRAAIVG